MPKIACAHPGKIGDALWALPAIRALCEKHQAKADFYTSIICSPMQEIMEVQECIEQVFILRGFQMENAMRGVQPWEMKVPDKGYEKIYQLGFHAFPDRCIGEWIAYHAGLPMEIGSKVRYDGIIPHSGPEDYICIASRGDTEFSDLLREFAKLSPMPCYEIGTPDQYIGAGKNLTCDSMMAMAGIIAGAKVFVGLTSSPLVIANGFPMKKIIPYVPGTNLHHLLHTENHHYLKSPIVEEMLDLL